MRDIWVVSDTHFGHANIIKYCNRPFKSVYEMNETMLENWNSVVKDEDIVYHLGDVYFPGGFEGEAEGLMSSRQFLSRLKGRKRLVLGNHDDGLNKNLQFIFQKIVMWRNFKEFGLLLTHVPVHPNTLNEKTPINIHGHIHNHKAYSKEYINVSVEQINYTPVNIESLRVR